MDYFLAQIILIGSNGDEESTFWMLMLVLVILAGVVGVGGLIKTRANKLKERYYAERPRGRYVNPRWKIRRFKKLKDKYAGIFLRTAQRKAVVEERVFDFDSGEGERKDELGQVRDLAGGMEILEEDFLVRIVEETEGDDNNDVMIRKLSFNELVRRGKLGAADSGALKVYVVNERNVYSKDIQCEAMKELAERTAELIRHSSGQSSG